MSKKKIVIPIASKHIERGIKKYQGEIDTYLHTVIKAAGFGFTPYLLNDGRILLVLPNNTAAFLYPNKEVLFNTLNLA
jgi:hypothetical protein